MNQNNKYHVLPLTLEQVRTGDLGRIMAALHEASSQSIKSARDAGRRGELVEMLMGFDNSTTNPTFHEQFGDDVFNVLFLNDQARGVLEEAGLSLHFANTLGEPSDGHMSRMYLMG